MPEIIINLPWAPSKLTPNGAKGDYQGKARAAKAYKTECAWECKRQLVRKMDCDNVSVSIMYHPPTNGRNDWDNLATKFKQGWDAISEAIGVDDGEWWPVVSDKGEKVKGGCVVVRITPKLVTDIEHRGKIG